jgi:hypothetical protein
LFQFLSKLHPNEMAEAVSRNRKNDRMHRQHAKPGNLPGGGPGFAPEIFPKMTVRREEMPRWRVIRMKSGSRGGE